MRNEPDDQDDVAELFEQFFEAVSYHGMKRGMAKFVKGLSPGQQPPSQPGEAGARLEADPTKEERRLDTDERHEQPALTSPGGKLPAPLIKRLGTRPKQDPRQRPVGEDEAPEERRDPEP
jgi:hypothetical protein